MCPEQLLTKRPDTFAQTKPAIFIFRLQYGDGPYIEHLVRVQTVRTSHQRHTRTRLQRQLCYAPLLR
jgi:hypothetical protein